MVTEKEMYRLELEKRLAEAIKKMPDSQCTELQSLLSKAMESMEADENGKH
ncbi:MAG: hypothetical protein LUD55_08095 [Oscillospiraceae bacterium]|nr:hypothetical protein [Oscillospiraceae bacterium]